MDKEMLLKRKAVIEKQFEEYDQKKAEIDAEMKRLQGEHRLILELLKSDELGDEPKRLRKVKVEDATN